MRQLLIVLISLLAGCSKSGPECPELIGTWRMDVCATAAFPGNRAKDREEVGDLIWLFAINSKTRYKYDESGTFYNLTYGDSDPIWRYSLVSRKENATTVHHVSRVGSEEFSYNTTWLTLDEDTLVKDMNGTFWAVFKRKGTSYASNRTGSLNRGAWLDTLLYIDSYREEMTEALDRGDQSIIDDHEKIGCVIRPAKGTRVLVMDSEFFPFIRVVNMYGKHPNVIWYVHSKFLDMDHPDIDLKRYNRKSDIKKKWSFPD